MARKAPTKDVETLVKALSVRLTAVEKDVLLLADRVTELEDENANLKKASPSKDVVIVGEVNRKPKMEGSTGNVEDVGSTNTHPILGGGTRWHKVCADKDCKVESCRRYCRKCDDETKTRSALKCYCEQHLNAHLLACKEEVITERCEGCLDFSVTVKTKKGIHYCGGLSCQELSKKYEGKPPPVIESSSNEEEEDDDERRKKVPAKKSAKGVKKNVEEAALDISKTSKSKTRAKTGKRKRSS